MSYSDLRTVAVICAAVGCLVYCNTLDLQFSFDDTSAVVNNRDIRVNETNWFDILLNDFWGVPMSSPDSHKSYRPLTVATFRLNYMLHELEPLGYHLVNVLLHGGVCYLYVLLCGVVFGEVWPALIAGLLFAVHPIHTEAVSGIVGRADVMAGLLSLLSLHFYRKSLSRKSMSLVWFVASQLLVVFSTLSKENGVTAAALCLLYELLIHHKMNLGSVSAFLFGDSKSKLTSRQRTWLRQWFRRVFMSAVIILPFLFFRIRMNHGAPSLSYFNNPAMKFVSPYRQLHWSYLCVLNVWLLLSPSQLCAEYAMDTIPPISSLSDPRNLLTLASSLSLLFLIVYSIGSPATHQRTTLFGLCLTTVPFLPASNLFFPVGFVIAERVLYLPSMGFCLLISYGFWCTIQKARNSKTTRTLIYSVLIYLILIFSLKTMLRSRDWMDSASVYRSACKTSPRNPKMLNFLATIVLLPEKKFDLAEKLYYYAIDVEPRYISVHRNLAELLRRVGKTNESIQVLREGTKQWMAGEEEGKNFYHNDKNIQVVSELAKNLQEYTNSYLEAISLSDYAIGKRPRWVTPRRTKSACLLKLNRIVEAEAAIEDALAIKSFPEGLLTKGDIMEVKGELKEAEGLFRQALKMKGDSVEAKMRVAHVLIETLSDEAMFHEAELLLTQVLKSETSSKALYHLCELHRKSGNRAVARNYCNQSLQFDPDSPGPLHALGLFNFEEKDYNESVRLMRHLLSVSPNHLTGMVQLGTSLMELGQNTSEAKSLFLSALSLDPNHPQALRHLGILHIKLKELTEAHNVLSRLLTLEPSDVAVARQLEILRKSMNKTSIT